jgi:hypothetical protein
MTEDALRSLVREVVRRHLQERPALAAPATGRAPAHPSHLQFALARGADTGGPCLVEPAAACVHCGYCRSWGY